MHKEHFSTTETPQKITEISPKCHGKSRKITEGFFQAPITEIVEALMRPTFWSFRGRRGVGWGAKMLKNKPTHFLGRKS